MKPEVSIIVPAYNAEKFLSRCLNTIASQTLSEFECIIVDDGSTDDTGKIADQFSWKDSRFRVIHQNNGGVAVARQSGIDAAIGEYTIHFDADDWVAPTILEELIAVAKEKHADMVMCDFWMVTPAGTFYDSQRPECLDSRIIFGQMMQQRQATLWNKLIRRECYQTYNLCFIPDMKMGEDQYICLSLLSHAVKVEYVPKALYYYDRTQNEQSLMAIAASPLARMRPLELIAESVDLTGVQDYFDRAVMVNAYQALLCPKSVCPNYSEIFKRYLPAIRRVHGYPWYVKALVILRIYGVYVPIYSIKKLLGRKFSYERMMKEHQKV